MSDASRDVSVDRTSDSERHSSSPRSSSSSCAGSTAPGTRRVSLERGQDAMPEQEDPDEADEGSQAGSVSASTISMGIEDSDVCSDDEHNADDKAAEAALQDSGRSVAC